MSYATPQNVYDLALPAQAFVNRPRPFEGVTPSTGMIRLSGHGYSSADRVLFIVTSGGGLPTNISATVYYWALPNGADLFQVSATQGGSPITFGSNGGSGWGTSLDPTRSLQADLDDTAAVIDEHLTAHEPPILPDPITGKLPAQIVGLNARMAARQRVTSLQLENAAYRVATDRLFAREEQDLKMLATWLAGKPIQPRPTDQDAIPDNAARAEASRKPLDWTTGLL